MSPFLLDLLEDSQQRCSEFRNRAAGEGLRTGPSLAIVHAYADGPYDRSSFHLAGSAPLVAKLASYMSARAVKNLALNTGILPSANYDKMGQNDPITPHPTIGKVDHVSILPMDSDPRLDTPITANEWQDILNNGFEDIDYCSSQSENLSGETTLLTGLTCSGWAARTVGRALEDAGVEVFYYGKAHPSKISLATVRRESTRFFKELPPDASDSTREQAAVGAPDNFVENYNIQVMTKEKATAQSLTRYVRTRDGSGLPFVEALTLPYYLSDGSTNHLSSRGPGRSYIYEVACNLLDPIVTSATDIDARIHEWTESRKANGQEYVETKAYRVGTTIEMCEKALDETSTPTREDAHNKRVLDRLRYYLGL